MMVLVPMYRFGDSSRLGQRIENTSDKEKARIRQIQIHCTIIVVIVVIMDGYIPPSGL